MPMKVSHPNLYRATIINSLECLTHAGTVWTLPAEYLPFGVPALAWTILFGLVGVVGLVGAQMHISTLPSKARVRLIKLPVAVQMVVIAIIALWFTKAYLDGLTRALFGTGFMAWRAIRCWPVLLEPINRQTRAT